MNIKVVRGKVTKWHPSRKVVILANGEEIGYTKLCIATGGRPKEIFVHPLILTIRDTDTVENLKTKLRDAKRIVVVGNGGIATEIVYELKNIEIIWAVKHSSISATFFDECAAEFFKPMLISGFAPETETSTTTTSKRYNITIDKDGFQTSEATRGCALGPDWAQDFNISGRLKERSVIIIYNVELESILSDDQVDQSYLLADNYLSNGQWPLFIKLSDNQVIGCDLLIQATGVLPNSNFWKQECDQLHLASDGGILVDDHMRTSIEYVYACGDVCAAGWNWSKHWLQMRLWTQAYQMGTYCGRSMVLSDVPLDFCFELFTHVTNFFGFKVIFLGRFNGDGVEKPWHLLLRINANKQYIKLIVKDGRIQGAILVGETNLEETIENLILNQIDISSVEEGLLDPEIDIDDYFD